MSLLRVVLNIIWLVVAGFWLVIGHILTAIAQAITNIGTPLAIANLKVLPVTLMPLGKDIVPSDRPFAPAYGARLNSSA